MRALLSKLLEFYQASQSAYSDNVKGFKGISLCNSAMENSLAVFSAFIHISFVSILNHCQVVYGPLIGT